MGYRVRVVEYCGGESYEDSHDDAVVWETVEGDLWLYNKHGDVIAKYDCMDWKEVKEY